VSLHDYLKQNLNTEQRAAVLQEGAVMVVAGAGSGKTRVITARIAYLIREKNADPASIVALTFTNKAAGEMGERLATFLESHTSLPFIGTFHAYCLSLLRANPGILPFPAFSILDADDQRSLFKKLIKYYGLEKKVTASTLGHVISNAKNKMLQRDSAEHDFFPQPFFKELYLAYESEKAAQRSLDFDDLILQTLSAFHTNTPFRESFQHRIRHLLVDETTLEN